DLDGPVLLPGAAEDEAALRLLESRRPARVGEPQLHLGVSGRSRQACSPDKDDEEWKLEAGSCEPAGRHEPGLASRDDPRPEHEGPPQGYRDAWRTGPPNLMGDRTRIQCARRLGPERSPAIRMAARSIRGTRIPHSFRAPGPRHGHTWKGRSVPRTYEEGAGDGMIGLICDVHN